MNDSSAPSPVVLLVEDDAQVRNLVRSILSSRNLRILEASTGAEGLRAALESKAEINLLITDMLLPELSGYDLADKLRERFPRMKIIMMTGYVEGEIVLRSVHELQAAFLDKPFEPSELRRLVAEALPPPVTAL